MKSRDRRQLFLFKGDHKYIFNYNAGQESRIVEEIYRMATNPEIELDFDDARVLAYEIGRKSEAELEMLISQAT